VAGDLGEAEINGLTESFQQAVNTTPDGQLSQAIRTPVGLHLVMVCGRRSSGAQLPNPRTGRGPLDQPAAGEHLQADSARPAQHRHH